MAFGSPRRGNGLYVPLADINVTPLVDVMLVLLIVFMITAPLLATGMRVNLPQAKSSQPLDPKEPVIVTVAKDGKIYLQKEVVTADALVPKLQAISQNGYDQRIFVRGDKTVAYDRVMVVMGLLASAGFTHIGLVTDVAKPKPEQH